jgi:hypothetical protein
MISPNAPPSVRCGACGYDRGYRHSTCPRCYADDGDGFWLGCPMCGLDWLSTRSPAYAGQTCPRCDHGLPETVRAPPAER